MDIIIGPILKRAGGYVFDTWNALEGLSQGYPYRRIEDANYARNATIRAGESKADLRAIGRVGMMRDFTLRPRYRP